METYGPLRGYDELALEFRRRTVTWLRDRAATAESVWLVPPTRPDEPVPRRQPGGPSP